VTKTDSAPLDFSAKPAVRGFLPSVFPAESVVLSPATQNDPAPAVFRAKVVVVSETRAVEMSEMIVN
jgi:hypothetical protein